MISINKYEKEIVLERLPDTYVTRTMKQHSDRHHYFCEETPQVVRLLKEIRGEASPRSKSKRSR